jgi:hypothetical protein
VISSAEAAFELLDTRGRLLSLFFAHSFTQTTIQEAFTLTGPQPSWPENCACSLQPLIAVIPIYHHHHHHHHSAGWDKGLGYARGPHQARFREFRRLMHQFMGPRGALSSQIVQAQEDSVRKLLLELLASPRDYAESIRQ